MEDAAKWLHAGRVGTPHGLDGSFRVAEASPRLLEEGGIVLIDGVERRIERRAGFDARVILRLEGFTDRESVQALRGQDLQVPRTVAPELEEDEWWAEDLEGLEVRDGAAVVGVVRRLLALPSCEVLEVSRADGGSDLLVPLVSDAVRLVDLEDGYVDVDMEFLDGD
jgi:16S rRNA processing protein RimM